MLNPIAELTVNQLFIFDIIVIVVTVIACLWRVRALDPTTRMPVPVLPPEPDPYELAYLRGGENELIRVVTMALIQRDRLIASSSGNPSDTQIYQAPGRPDVDELSSLERTVFDWFSESRKPEEMFESGGLPAIVGWCCLPFEERLQHGRLLVSEEEKTAALSIFFYGAAAIVAVTVLILLVGVGEKKPFPFGILMGLGFMALVISYQQCETRLSRLGNRYVEQAQAGLQWLKSSAESTPAHFALLVGAFGTAVLADTAYGHFQEIFEKGTSSDDADCGGGCEGCGGCGCG